MHTKQIILQRKCFKPRFEIGFWAVVVEEVLFDIFQTYVNNISDFPKFMEHIQKVSIYFALRHPWNTLAPISTKEMDSTHSAMHRTH
jgi:uncharacterized membrane protein